MIKSKATDYLRLVCSLAVEKMFLKRNFQKLHVGCLSYSTILVHGNKELPFQRYEENVSTYEHSVIFGIVVVLCSFQV